MFSVDFFLQIRRLLPPWLRQARMLAWLWSLLKSLAELYGTSSTLNAVRYPNCPPLPAPSLLAFREHINLRLSFTGQTLVLERLLNLYYYSLFDPAVGPANPGYKIWIDDVVSDLQFIFLFLNYENQPIPLYRCSEYPVPPPAPANGNAGTPGPQYLSLLAEYASETDFIVWVPASLVFDELEMRTLINLYKMAGAKYQFLTY